MLKERLLWVLRVLSDGNLEGHSSNGVSDFSAIVRIQYEPFAATRNPVGLERAPVRM